MQDWSPLYRSSRAQRWCEEDLPNFWVKETWLRNNPDLNFMKKLRSIDQQGVVKQRQATSLQRLQAQLQRAWSKKRPSVL